MADVIPGGGGGPDWDTLLYVFLTGAIGAFFEYLRRKMPPERRDRREEDHHEHCDERCAHFHDNDDEGEDAR